MKLINLFETKSSLMVRWVWIFRKNWPNSGEISQKNSKCAAKPEMDGGHFVFWDIEPEMLGHISGNPLGHRPVILLSSEQDDRKNNRTVILIGFSQLCECVAMCVRVCVAILCLRVCMYACMCETSPNKLSGQEPTKA